MRLRYRIQIFILVKWTKVYIHLQEICFLFEAFTIIDVFQKKKNHNQQHKKSGAYVAIIIIFLFRIVPKKQQPIIILTCDINDFVTFYFRNKTKVFKNYTVMCFKTVDFLISAKVLLNSSGTVGKFDENWKRT